MFAIYCTNGINDQDQIIIEINFPNKNYFKDYFVYFISRKELQQLMSNIKYFGFAKQSASVPVLGLILQQSDEDQIKIQSTKVLGQLKQLELRADERQKIKSQNGSWHCKKDNRGVIYLALCSSNYPQRHIYAAINQIRDHLAKLGDYESEPDSTIKLHARQTLQEICKNYQNLKTFDKVSAVSFQVDQAKSQIRENTEKIMDNMINLDPLQKKSDHLREKALLFQSTSEDLEYKMHRRNCKIKVIIVIVAVALILLIIIPIATKKVK